MKGLCDTYLQKVAEVVTERCFHNGEVILDEQVDVDQFYILVTGQVLILHDDASSTPTKTSIYPGTYFGAKRLLGGQAGNRIYKSLSSSSKVFILDRLAFQELIVPLEALGRLQMQDEQENSRPTPLLQNKYAALTLAELTAEGTLGVGGFGQVDLVHAAGFDEKFALKRLAKEHIVRNSQEEHVLNEKRVLERLNSPFCVSLLATFKDDSYVYLMMDVCLGGELWLLLKRNGFLKEESAKFYVASVVEGLTYIHSIGFVYRDLKPENIMIDSTGYVKIVDFGFAKKLDRNEKTWTFCGTPDYMAPEIVMNHGHDSGADLWSLGVLVFELVCGRPPFASKDPMDTYNKIILGIDRVKFPRHFPEAAKSLVTSLCRECSSERLGNLHEGMAGIRTHRWFQDFGWQQLHKHSLEPPTTPSLAQLRNVPELGPTDAHAEVGPLQLDEDF
jgi:cGMP-dependent protein kinase